MKPGAGPAEALRALPDAEPAGEIFFDCPRRFVGGDGGGSPYLSGVPAFAALVRACLDTPAAQLLEVLLADDRRGLVDILPAGGPAAGSGAAGGRQGGGRDLAGPARRPDTVGLGSSGYGTLLLEITVSDDGKGPSEKARVVGQ